MTGPIPPQGYPLPGGQRPPMPPAPPVPPPGPPPGTGPVPPPYQPPPVVVGQGSPPPPRYVAGQQYGAPTPPPRRRPSIWGTPRQWAFAGLTVAFLAGLIVWGVRWLTAPVVTYTGCHVTEVRQGYEYDTRKRPGSSVRYRKRVPYQYIRVDGCNVNARLAYAYPGDRPVRVGDVVQVKVTQRGPNTSSSRWDLNTVTWR